MMTCRKFETEREQVTKWLSLEPVGDVSVDEEEEEEMKRRTSAKSEDGEEMVKKVVICRKSPPGSPGSSGGSSKEGDIVLREFALLECMERFWVIYSKVDVEYMEMRQEKRMLLGQNKHFRGMIRAVLEAAALDQTNPTSKVSTRVASKKSREPQSAPLRRILI